MKKRRKLAGYTTDSRKKARINSANTVTAKAFMKFARELEKGLKSGTESQCKK